MTMRPYLLTLFTLTAFTSCNSGNMTVSSYDGQTGQSTTKTYSKYYDEGVWLSPEHLGLCVAVDHEKGRIPVVSGVQQSLGALGPNDSYARGKVTIYLWNFDNETHPVKITRITSNGQSLSPNAVINALPKKRSGAEVGDLRISNYGTEVTLTVEYEWKGKRGRKELTLPRRTWDQLESFHNIGHFPYPWNDYKHEEGNVFNRNSHR